MIFLILALLIWKIGALVVFVFSYDTMVAVSLQTHTFMRAPFLVTIVAFLGLLSDAISAAALAFCMESAISASSSAFHLSPMDCRKKQADISLCMDFGKSNPDHLFVCHFAEQ